jgi:hypothetical protein
VEERLVYGVFWSAGFGRGSVREGRVESGRYGERRDRQNRVSRVFSLVYLGYLWVFFRLLFGTMAWLFLICNARQASYGSFERASVERGGLGHKERVESSSSDLFCLSSRKFVIIYANIRSTCKQAQHQAHTHTHRTHHSTCSCSTSNGSSSRPSRCYPLKAVPPTATGPPRIIHPAPTQCTHSTRDRHPRSPSVWRVPPARLYHGQDATSTINASTSSSRHFKHLLRPARTPMPPPTACPLPLPASVINSSSCQRNRRYGLPCVAPL